MNCLSNPPSERSKEDELELSQIVTAAFVLGWTTADEGNLPWLAEVIGRWLGASCVRVCIQQNDGKIVRDDTYLARVPEADSEETRAEAEASLHEFDLPLGRELTFKLSIQGGTAEATAPQSRSVDQVVSMIHAALECLYVHQNDRKALGAPFDSLSNREWQVCRALEGSKAEKQIAEQLSCSPHTLHTYVKSVYRRMEAKSRLEVIDRLRRARQLVRRSALKRLAAAGTAAQSAKAAG